jgi:hypothetical protein
VTAKSADRSVTLNDFVQIMLEEKWKSDRVKAFILDYHKRSKIDIMGMRELFLLFAVKRKLKLLSYMVNNVTLEFQMNESIF